MNIVKIFDYVVLGLSAVLLTGCSVTVNSRVGSAHESAQERLIIAACAGQYPVDLGTMSPELHELYLSCMDKMHALSEVEQPDVPADDVDVRVLY